MRNPPRILIADDMPANAHILQLRLGAQGYETLLATDGEQALALAKEANPDLILLDIMMPKMDGIEVCRQLRADASFPFVPIIMVTAKTDLQDIIRGLEAGGDEYLTKPVEQRALDARVKSMLRIKQLHDTVQEMAEQLGEWNRTLQQRVTEQVAQLERLSRLKRFLSPQLAELVVSSANEDLLASHRREITVVFCDLREFTAFAEMADPEEVMNVLRQFHAAMEQEIFRFEGTLEHFAGDGLMVFFNDPFPCSDPVERAVRMAIAMREQVRRLCSEWERRGYSLGMGVGIAQGFATLGTIGFERRLDYGAIGTVTNLAARLCAEAQAGQILVSEPVCREVAPIAYTEPVGEMPLKGFLRPVATFNVLRLRDATLS